MPVRKSTTRSTKPEPIFRPDPARAGKDNASARIGGVSIALGFLSLLLGGWAFGSSYLLVSGNRLAGTAVQRAFELQDFYENQSAEYGRMLAATKAEYQRAQRDLERLEKIANERTGVEARLAELVRRQTQIESRQSALVRVAEQVSGAPVSATQGGTKVAAAKDTGLGKTRSILGMDEDEEKESFNLDPDDDINEPVVEQRGDAGDDALGGTRALKTAMPALPDGKALEITNDLLQRVATVEQGQIASMKKITDHTEERARLLRQAAEAAGRELNDVVDSKRIQAVRAVSAVAKPLAEDGSTFGVSLTNLRRNLTEIKRLSPVVNGLPIRIPVSVENRISSRFGERSDPFLGTKKFHAGQDFAMPTGAAVYSTGAGTVLSAGNGGGYGNLVQVDHGNGLVTRYAHLSEINVTVGQPITAGQIVGRAGSTGRSTGPHLHYETRVHNVPNDPLRLMRFGAQLGIATNPGSNAVAAAKPVAPKPAAPAK